MGSIAVTTADLWLQPKRVVYKDHPRDHLAMTATRAFKRVGAKIFPAGSQVTVLDSDEKWTLVYSSTSLPFLVPCDCLRSP